VTIKKQLYTHETLMEQSKTKGMKMAEGSICSHEFKNIYV